MAILDLNFEGSKDVDFDLVNTIISKKTAALVETAALYLYIWIKDMKIIWIIFQALEIILVSLIKLLVTY